MNKKKLVLSIVTVVLVCALSVTGTLAFLTATSNGGEAVTNTFVADGGGKLLDDHDGGDEAEFTIHEQAVKQDENGNYVPDTDADPTETGIDYSIVPGMVLPKKATIKIVGKTTVASRLYLEVVKDFTDGVFDETEDANSVEKQLEANGWVAVLDSEDVQLQGNNGGDLYVYQNLLKATGEENDKLADYTGEKEIPIIEQLKIDDDADVEGLTEDDKDSIEFYAYLAQAATGEDDTAADTFTKCFLAAEPTP